MGYNPDIHHRRSIRLKGYDYSQPGAYFLTICTQDRKCLYGEIVDDKMRLNDAGQMVQTVWDEIPAYYPGIDIDAFMIMPNHIHGIIKIVGAAPTQTNANVGAAPCGRPNRQPQNKYGQPRGVAPTGLSLPDVVNRFKTMTTKRYADGVKQHGWPAFPGKLWQSNYYERVIRDEHELSGIREYIAGNPAQWTTDTDNPFVVGAAPRGRPEPTQTKANVGATPCGRPHNRQPPNNRATTGQMRATTGSNAGNHRVKCGQPQGVAPTLREKKGFGFMTVETFFTNFGHLADAPNGVQKLRELILQLAVQGKLVPQDAEDEPASVFLERIRAEKESLLREKKTRASKTLPEITVDEAFYPLPKGWEWVRLGELGETQTGTTPPKKDKENCGNYIPFVGPGNIKDHVIDYSGEGLSELGLSKGRLIEKNSILMVCIGGSIGKHAINEQDISCNQQINTITPYLCISVKYIFYATGTRLFQNFVVEEASGSATPIINKQKWSSIPIPLPPEPEQKRIVAKVDKLMALCDELEARQQKKQQVRVRLNNAALDGLLTAREPDEFADHWQRICNNFDLLYDHPETITKLRAAILQLAVQGKLVPQDPNDEPASVLLERIRVEKERLVKEGKIKKQKKLPAIKDEEKRFELPVGWVWSRVWNVAEMITSGSRGWAKYYADKGPIFVTMGNLSRGHYKLRMETIRYVNPPIAGEGSRTRLVENDLLISITGDVGNLGLITKDFGEAYINQHTCLLRFMPECQSRYFPELMRSPLATLQYDAPQRGIKNSFRLGDVGEMIIPVPPLKEQKRIVAKVDQLMALCDQLEAKLNQTRQQSEKLMTATVRHLLVA